MKRHYLMYILLISIICTTTHGFAQLMLSNANPTRTIDFSNTTPASVGTNPPTAFSAAGFAPNTTTAGRLNSNAWAITGMSDGNLNFGDSITSGDLARGTANAAVGTGGLYAYTGAPHSTSNPALMIQPVAADWTPGTLTLRIQNAGTTNITDLAVSYNLYIRNDQAFSNSFNFSHSTDNITYTPIPALDYTSPAAADAFGWVLVGTAPSRNTTITGLSIPPGGFYYIRWSGDDVTGSGSRDEFGLDDITVSATFVSAQTITTSAISGSPFCVTAANDAPVTVDFTYTPGGVFAGATFTAELSDASGSFVSPVVIGTVSADTSGNQTISANIPAGTLTGTGYRIRVVSDSPAVTGADNNADLTINLADVNVTPVTPQTIIVNSNGNMLTANESSTALSRQWLYGTVSGGPYTVVVDTAISYTPNFATPGTYYVVVESTFDCGIITSNEVEITVNAAGTPDISITGASLIPFTSFTDCPSPSQSYNVSGNNLTDDIIINAPAEFEISTDDIVWFNSITLLQSSGTVSPTIIYVRYNPATSGSHSGDITHNTSGAAQENVVVSGMTTESVVINKYNIATDEVELLVIEDNLNMQGMIIKDFSDAMTTDNGGKFEFTNNSLWSSIPSGTLIILRNDNTATDTDATDYTLDIGLLNTTYFTNLGGTWDLEGSDMVMIKEAGSGGAGLSGNIHVLAAGTAGTLFTNTGEPKLISTTAATTGSPFVYAINTNSVACDYIGTNAGVTSGLVFGEANTSTNQSYICILRNFPQPTIIASGPVAFCEGDSVVLDAGAGYITYLWSNNDTTQTITVTAGGNYTVTVGDAAGCTAASTNSVNVVVNPLPTVTLGNFAAVCNNDPAFTLTGGSPSGGTYSGSGVSGGMFNPAVAGVGMHQIIYSYTDTSGCTNSDTSSITVNNCSTVPTIQLLAAYCPYNMSTINDLVYAERVSGATNYEYYIEEVGNPNPFTATYQRNSSSSAFGLGWVPGIQFNTTYAVQVRAQVGTQWGVFGPACNVTTPSSLPTTSIMAQYCNTTLNNLHDIMHANAVWQAINYEYEITDLSTSNVTTYQRGSGSYAFSLGWVQGINYNTSYSIRVRANINGDWTAFGAACTLTTPSIPSTQLQNQFCNVTLPTLNTTMLAQSIAGATDYRYTISDSLGFNTVYDRGSASTKFSLGWIPGIQTNTTYYIGVQALVGGNYTPTGTICSVTTPSMARFNFAGTNIDATHSFSVYPNPSTGNEFTVVLDDMNGESFVKIDIYDLTGKLMWNTHINTSASEIILSPEVALPDGIYTISVLKDEKVQFKKLIIQK